MRTALKAALLGALPLLLWTGVAAGLKISKVEPAEGPLAGGTRIVIHGEGFVPGTKVSIDDEPATGVRVLGPTRIEAVTPAVMRKTRATVGVETPAGTVRELTDAFSYYGPWDWLRVPGLVLLILFLVFLGSPLFLILGGISVYCFLVFLEWPGLLGSFSEQFYALFNPFVDSMYRMITGNEVLLAIPFFILSGEIMTAGSIARKLVAFARALLGWMPGGLAVAAVGACMFFAAISGSSPVTVIAIGSIMMPALVSDGYPERFSVGLVTSAGSLGILIPPSIPMIVYVIMVGSGFLVEDLFKAGIGPGLLIGGLLVAYSIFVAKRTPTLARRAAKLTFAQWRSNVATAFADGFWALMLPVVILGGIYGGLFTATAAGVVSVAYAYVVEVFIHRDIRQRQLPHILTEAARLMGSILIILAFAFAFNYFLGVRQIPNAAAAWLGSLDLGPVGFMLLLNGLLLVVGMLMDIMSAIMVLAPLIAPMAAQVGIDPIHLGIVFIVNLEIGYLTPPIGLNLFVACTLFRKSFGEVMRSVIPFTLVMFAGLLLITYVPSISVGLGGIFDGKPLYVPFPSGPPPQAAPDKQKRATQGRGTSATAPPTRRDGGLVPAPPRPRGKVKSMQELMREADQHRDAPREDAGRPTPDGGAGKPRPRVKSMQELMREAGEPDEGAAPPPRRPSPDGGVRPKQKPRVKSMQELMRESGEPDEDE